MNKQLRQLAIMQAQVYDWFSELSLVIVEPTELVVCCHADNANDTGVGAEHCV